MTTEKTPEGLLEVGRFGRPHGVKGQIYIKLSTDRSERVQVGAQLWAGEWFEVSARTSMANTGADRWVVGLVGIDDRNDVERLVNKVVWAEPIDDQARYGCIKSLVHELLMLVVLIAELVSLF